MWFFQGVPRPSVPRQNKPRRVDLYYSSWCIRPGTTVFRNSYLQWCSIPNKSGELTRLFFSTSRIKKWWWCDDCMWGALVPSWKYGDSLGTCKARHPAGDVGLRQKDWAWPSGIPSCKKCRRAYFRMRCHGTCQHKVQCWWAQRRRQYSGQFIHRQCRGWEAKALGKQHTQGSDGRWCRRLGLHLWPWIIDQDSHIRDSEKVCSTRKAVVNEADHRRAITCIADARGQDASHALYSCSV